MEGKENFNVSNNDLLLIEFEIVILEKVIECRVSCNSTLKKALHSLKQCLDEASGWYDFKEAVVMDPISKNYLHPSLTLQECGCRQGTRLLVF